LVNINLFGQTNFTASTAQIYNLKQLNTSISGEVYNVTDNLIQFHYYKNNLSFKKESLIAPISKDGFFKIDFDLSQSTEIQMTYDGRTIPLYVQRGDDLKISLDGVAFPASTEYTGRGGYNNQYLADAANKFNYVDKGYLLYEVAQRDGLSFKRHMDGILIQKNNYYQEYNNAAKSKMTPEFKQYIDVENKFWHANQLINYRTEKALLSGGSPSEKIPSSFYDFLEDLDLTENVVLSNRSYCEFLEEYLKFKGEEAAVENTLNYAHKVLLEQNILYAENGSFVHLNVGDKVAILDQELSAHNKNTISRLMPVFEAQALDYIKLENGTKGWVSNLNANSLGSNTVSELKSEKRIKKYAISKKYNAQLYKDPTDQQSAVAALGYGEEVKYLHLQTSERFKYYHQGIEYYGKLVQVETQSKKKGWILDSFIEVKEKEVSSAEVPASYLYSLTDTSEARKYLEGESLNFALAKALYWKIKLNKNEDDIAREIAAFASHNQYKVLNKILRAEYDVEQLRKKSDDPYIETYAYSNLKSPVISGVEIGLPFDKSAFISATKAQSEKEYVDISCQLAERPSSNLELRGKIYSSYHKQVNLTIVYDFISYKEEKSTLEVDQQGMYHFSTSLKDPVLAYLECGGKSIELYIYPGDIIDIDFDAQNFPNSVRFAGKSADLNTYLFEERIIFAIQMEIIKKKAESISPSQFAKLAESLYKKRKLHFEKYQKKQTLNSQDRLFISSNIYFYFASQMFNYEDTQRFLQARETIELPKGFYSFLHDMPISVEGVLPNIHYASFIHQFLDYQLKLPINESSNKLDLAKQFFKGEVYAFIQAKELATMCQLGKSYEYGQKIQNYIDTNPYAQFNDVLRVVYNENKPIQNGATAPDFVLSDINGYTVKLSELKGKVVYIDFWATWCRPCIKSLTYSQRLLDKYNSDEVVFLYVSMDKKLQPWKSYVTSQDLKGFHMNANSGQGYLSDIAKLYKVKQLPTFVIIDKSGKIAFNRAGSPSSKVVTNLINGLLEDPKF